MRRHPRTTVLVVAVSVAALAVAIVALGSDGGSDRNTDAPPPGRACTLIACSSGLTIRLSQPPARVCVEGTCGQPRPLGAAGTLSARLPEASRRAGARVNAVVDLLERMVTSEAYC